NLDQIYSHLPAVSIDHGLMEKLLAQACVPCELGWDDLGSWDDIAAAFERNPNFKAASQSVVVSSDSSQCFTFGSEMKTIGLLGVRDLLVVDTPDALLVARRGSSQHVRALVEELGREKAALRTLNENGYDLRPWGQYTVVREEDDYKVKVIEID